MQEFWHEWNNTWSNTAFFNNYRGFYTVRTCVSSPDCLSVFSKKEALT